MSMEEDGVSQSGSEPTEANFHPGGPNSHHFGYDIATVAFLDILGWSNLIMQSETDVELLRRMIRAMEQAGFPIIFPGRGAPALKSGYPSLSVFSDSMILSVSMTAGERYGTDMFWQSIDSVGKILLKNGFFVRGAIAQGTMYHTGQIAVGGALAKAHFLESKKAIYPRIILEKNQDGETVVSTGPDEGEHAIATRASNDGWESIDLLRYSPQDRKLQGDRADELQISFLKEVRPIIHTNLDSDLLPKDREKHEWFATYFNEIAAEFGLNEISI